MEAFGFTAGPSPSTHGLGWSGFSDLDLVMTMVTVLVMSLLLASVIAYHPALQGRAQTLEDFEQPKTLIMYAVVGAVIAVIVRAQPNMALVVFGIGGLLRFRTNVGEAKDTGRVILVTVVGLCCGLQLYVVATLATLFGWVLIGLLEWRAPRRLTIQALDAKNIEAAAERHAQALRDAGVDLLGVQMNVRRGVLTLLYRARGSTPSDALKQQLDQIPDDLRGVRDWGA